MGRNKRVEKGEGVLYCNVVTFEWDNTLYKIIYEEARRCRV